MAEYRLLDTGYANTTQTGVQETRAYGGTAMQLASVNLVYGFTNGQSAEPNPGAYEDSEVNYVSVSNPIITLKGVISINNPDFLAFVKGLNDMCRTKGLKLFYYSAMPFNTIIGAISTGLQVTNQNELIGVGIPAVLVTCSDFTYSDSGTSNQTKGLKSWTMKLTLTTPKN